MGSWATPSTQVAENSSSLVPSYFNANETDTHIEDPDDEPVPEPELRLLPLPFLPATQAMVLIQAHTVLSQGTQLPSNAPAPL